MSSPPRPPAAKRRKYNASAALNAPFKSPLRRNPAIGSSPGTTTDESSQQPSCLSALSSSPITTSSPFRASSPFTASSPVATSSPVKSSSAETHGHSIALEKQPLEARERGVKSEDTGSATDAGVRDQHEGYGQQEEHVLPTRNEPSKLLQVATLSSPTSPRSQTNKPPALFSIPTTKSHPNQASPSTPAPTSTPSSPQHPPIPSNTTPQAHLTQLKAHLSHLRRANTQLVSALDTVTQALRIQASPRDAELRRLTCMWRSAAREAAEELFAVARDRVNGMGGVRGWKERERGRRERMVEWEREGREAEREAEREGREGEEDEEGKGEKDRVCEERDWVQDEEGEERTEAWEEADEEGGFTMDMMLRSMNVDLRLIGWDLSEQRWIT